MPNADCSGQNVDVSHRNLEAGRPDTEVVRPASWVNLETTAMQTTLNIALVVEHHLPIPDLKQATRQLSSDFSNHFSGALHFGSLHIILHPVSAVVSLTPHPTKD